MVYEISFSEKASGELTVILEHIEKEWSLTISHKFIEIFNDKINHIRHNPYDVSVYNRLFTL